MGHLLWDFWPGSNIRLGMQNSYDSDGANKSHRYGHYSNELQRATTCRQSGAFRWTYITHQSTYPLDTIVHICISVSFWTNSIPTNFDCEKPEMEHALYRNDQTVSYRAFYVMPSCERTLYQMSQWSTIPQQHPQSWISNCLLQPIKTDNAYNYDTTMGQWFTCIRVCIHSTAITITNVWAATPTEWRHTTISRCEWHEITLIIQHTNIIQQNAPVRWRCSESDAAKCQHENNGLVSEQ